ncbi:MAG: beta-ketoacyl-[acyl-carrier-protein] synthase family protein [Lachnospiraceae bacterium]|nr:beta-ketoacyl-[acyl-carrier-protein] synthase family protein [Lachnospiraceae bacterium]
MNKQINTRCVVTGLGLINAIGNDVNECWTNALAGKTGIDVVKSVNADECYANLGAEVECADLDKYQGVDRATKLCLKASEEAFADAAIDISKEDASRFGVVMGSCVGGVVSIENYVVNGQNTEDIRKMAISSIANHVANRVGAGGVITNVGNACAAGTIPIAYACELIRAGVADMFIVGGADAFASVPFAGFTALHALSEQPCSPFNHCNGITLGEGAGAIVVESYEHAQKRNAKIYCDVLAAGISSDAHHITAPREDGVGQMYAIRTAIANSGVDAKEIGYVNAHGTGTGKNDNAEFLSLHTIFDDVNDNLSVSSTKSMVGHCLGAAGAIEAVYAIKALTENKIPPTIGYSDEDLAVLAEKAGKIDFMPNTMKEKELNYVMSNSFAFGGSNASIIFGKQAGDVKETENDAPVYITGFGIVSPIGNGTENYIEKVKSGATISEASVKANVDKVDFDKYDVKMAFYRKLDKFSLMQVISGLEALSSAGIEIEEDKAEDYGMIIGTGDGPITTVYQFQEHITENGTKAGSAFNFPNTVYNAAGGYLSIKTNMRGYNVTVTNGAQSGMSSLCYAYNELRQNHAKFMLATGTDENSEVMERLYGQLGLVADGQAKLYGNTGMALSDGSTTIALEGAEFANARGAKKYAEVAGYGMSHAITEYGVLAGTEDSLEAAIASALKMAGIEASQIDAVYGFGDGIAEVDTVEKNVYGKLFDAKLPIHNVRSYVGESRAAAGTLSIAHAALTLSGELGDSQKAFFFGDEVTEGVADTSAYNYVLATSAADGGSYCAVVLKKA